jgi:hypothetical protein
MKPVHVTMLGVGISAIGVVAMILYYRNQAANAAAQAAAPDSGSGSFPYFQTAAVPSSTGDGGTVATTPTTDNSSIDSLLTQLVAGQNTAQATQGAQSLTATLGSYLTGLVSQQSQQLSASGGGAMWTPIETFGTINPTAGGGVSLSFANIPTSNIPQGSDMLKYIIDPTVAAAANSNSTGGSTPTPAASTQAA